MWPIKAALLLPTCEFQPLWKTVYAHCLHIVRVIQMELLLIENFWDGTLTCSPVRAKSDSPTGSKTPSSNHEVGTVLPRPELGSLLQDSCHSKWTITETRVVRRARHPRRCCSCQVRRASLLPVRVGSRQSHRQQDQRKDAYLLSRKHVHQTRTNSLLLTAARSMKGEHEEWRIPSATLLLTALN